MSNELPPPPTEMCEPVIMGINKLHKAIDDYWQSKYPTFAKGRIKRMRGNEDKGLGWCNVKTIRKIASPKLIYKTYYYQGAYPTTTRWNRH